jgi:hypothetical protein
MNAVFVNFRFLPLMTVLIAVCGCGKTDENLPLTFPVTGTVTYNGEPMATGSISALPQTEGDVVKPANGSIVDGKYELSTFESGDGALIGTHKVLISLRDERGTTSLIPQRYSDISRTPFTMEVVEGSNEFNFDLD